MKNGETYYFASSTYYPVINQVLTELDCIIAGSEISYEIYLLKSMKSMVSKVETFDCIIVELTAFLDVEEEIIKALEMVKVMADHVKIIVIATTKKEGDEFLTKIFQMGIYNIIATDDFNEIKKELKYCIETGMKYGDAIKFKDIKKMENKKTIEKTEIKQTVNKVMIGIRGSQKRIGTTHNSIIMANHLRKKGYMVALVEVNNSGHFEKIRMSHEEKMYDGYFSLNGVDYYSAADDKKLSNVLGKSYNFILLDLGSEDIDLVIFNKCDVRFIIAGAKPWEEDKVRDNIFNGVSPKTLNGYHYYFNFCFGAETKQFKESMKGLDSVHLLKVTENPFVNNEFPELEIVLKQYMPKKREAEKKKLFFGKDK